MALLPQSVQSIARHGASIEITAAAKYLPQSVEAIIKVAVAAGGHVTIEAGNYLPQTLEKFATIGGKSVTIRV